MYIIELKFIDLKTDGKKRLPLLDADTEKTKWHEKTVNLLMRDK